MDGKTHNYCHNYNTENCEIKSNLGISFPFCKCKNGYTGKYCEFKDNNIDLNENMETIINEKNSDKIENNLNIISKIRGIIFLFEKEKDKKYIETINDNKVDKYIKSSINNIKEIKKQKAGYIQIFDIIELSIYFLYYKIRNSKLRQLEQYKNDLKYILENAHYLNIYSNKNTNQLYNIQTDNLNQLTFISYKNSISQSEDFIKNVENKTYYIINEKSEKDDLIFLTIFNKKLFMSNDNNSSGLITYYSSLNSLTDFDNISYYLYFNDNNLINSNLAQYYSSKGINIYNKEDECFTNICYQNENFEFDLTQKYRKQNIYQRINFENNNCKIIIYNNTINKLIFLCDGFININNTDENISYAILDYEFQNNSIENNNKIIYFLPLKCKINTNKLGNNYGFLFFSTITILEILYLLFLSILNINCFKKVIIKKGLTKDDIINKNQNKEIKGINEIDEVKEKNIDDFNNQSNEKIKKEKNINLNNMNNNDKIIKNKKMFEYYCDNLKELHPIFSLFRISILYPLSLRSYFFTFNNLILFGFNAFFYTENYIEKRIFNNQRNSFIYPMKNEYIKIILSILCQIILTLIMKIVMTATNKKRNDLIKNINSTIIKNKDNDKEQERDIFKEVYIFEKSMNCIRFIGGLFMLVIIAFFFYYSTGFCSIYVNTQTNWIYSGIWSIIINWVVLAPLYILIISFLDKAKKGINNSSLYNIKRLFFL